MVFASRGYKIFEKIENIKAFLKEQSQIYQEEMDFYFLGFATFCNRHGENNFKKIHLLNLFDKDANYIAKVDIKQIYRVELCKKKERENLPFKVELIPQADTTLMATLIPKVKVEYYGKLKVDIYQELYRAMILEGYFVGIRESKQLESQIDILIEKLKFRSITSKITLKVASGVASIEGKSEKLEIYHKMQDESAICDLQTKFTPKVCLKAVHKGDLLLDYTKAIKGRIGRDLKGHILPAKSIQSHQIKSDLSIVALEDSAHIKFCARKDGFLKEIAPFYFIIDDELNTNKQETANLFKILKIDGLTHFDSKIEAKIAYIKSHKGNVKADIVVIDVLEKGIVEAKIAYVESMLGGKIVADYIYVKNVRSYNEIYFRYSLVVDNILGEHNLFECNPAKFAFNKKDRTEYLVLKKQLQVNIKHLRKRMDEVYTFLFTMQNKVHKITYTLQGKSIPKNLQNIVDQYDKSLKNYQKLLEEYRDIVNINYHNERLLRNIDKAVLEAKVIIRGEIGSAETMIRFKFYNNEQEEFLRVLFNKENPERFFEVVEDNNRFKIRASENYDEKQCDWIAEFFPKEDFTNLTPKAS